MKLNPGTAAKNKETFLMFLVGISGDGKINCSFAYRTIPSKYKFSASFDGIDWTPVDNAYVFDANFDGSTTVTRGHRLLNRSLCPRSVSCAWREANIEFF